MSRRRSQRQATAASPPREGRASSEAPQRFQSAAHPQDRPAALVYGRALAPPLGACLLPVMVVTAAAVLLGHAVLPELWAATGGAFVVAVAWARLRLRRTLAEVRVGAERAAVRSVHDVLRRQPFDWQPVLDLRVRDGVVAVAVGHEDFALRHADWPRREDLLSALQRARRHARQTPVGAGDA